MRNFEGMRYRFFRRTIEKNVIKEPAWHSRIPNAFVRWFMSQRYPESSVIKNQGDFDQASANPLTQRYFENTLGKTEKPAGVGTWLCEVSRVSIPFSRVGVVKSFQQFAIHPDVAGDTIYSLSENWGNPFLLSDVSGVDSVRWLWRVQDTSEVPVATVSAFNPSVIPGNAHTDIPVMDDIWFPAQSASGQNIHVTVGGGRTLRVFAEIVFSAEFALFVAGKISGYHLSQYDDMTRLAIRSIW